MSWIFLKSVLLKFGIHKNFVQLILNNLHASWFSVLINGAPSGFFKSSRGLKQGDPLSPYLFILLVEALGRCLKEQAISGNTFALPRGSIGVTHLMFADDLVVLTRATRKSLTKLFSLLDQYEGASGQKINRQKSSFHISKRCSLHHKHWIRSMTGLHEGQAPFRYLGCYLYKGRRKIDYFQHLLLSIHQRISGWMGRFLSPGGRLILIKHVLSTIPLHVFAVLEPPVAVLTSMERAFSNFLWNHPMSNATRTWSAWPKLAFPYAENGLGVRSFRDLLKAYSCKLWWKLRTMEGLWPKYVNSVGLNKSFVAGRVARVHDLMQAHPRILVGNGECSFWHANWSGQGCLSDIFPDVDPVSGNLNLYLHEGFLSYK